MITVIIPIYNRVHLLRRALESLRLQTEKKFFTIVVDDCSTEDVISVCDEFRSELHIAYKRLETNSGPGVARQIGLDMAIKAHIDFVVFLDADDILFPNAIERLGYEIKHTNSDIVASKITAQDKSGFVRLIGQDKCLTWCHGKIYRTRYLEEIGLTFSSLRSNEDLAFNLSAFHCSKKIGYIDEQTYLWTDAEESLTRSNDSDFCRTKNPSGYIEAIITAEIFLMDHGKLTNEIATPNIAMMYNYYQIHLIFDAIPAQLYAKLRSFMNLPLIKEFVVSSFGRRSLENTTRQCAIINKKLYFFKQSLLEYLREMGYKEGQF